jgi:stress response protein SCP2
MRPIALLAAGTFLACITFTSVSCEKETDCKAVVTCVDSVGTPVNNADVILYALVKSPDGKTTYTADVKAQGFTEGDGTVNFTFKLPAIYDIKATATVATRTLTGIGIIKLEEGKTIEKTVTMK